MIKKTTDYDKFKFLTVKGNREVKKLHVKKLAEAIEKNDMLEHNPVIVDAKFNVIDGQHRLLAAKSLGLPIYYTIKEKAGMEEVMLLNDNVKKWNAIDFVNAYSKQGLVDYTVLKEVMSIHKLPITLVAQILMFGTGNPSSLSGGGSVSGHLKEGTFKVNHLKHAETIFDALRRMRVSLGKKGYTRSRTFVRAFIQALGVEELSFDRLYHAAKVHSKLIGRQDSVNDYLRAFERAYNFRLKNKEIVRFF